MPDSSISVPDTTRSENQASEIRSIRSKGGTRAVLVSSVPVSFNPCKPHDSAGTLGQNVRTNPGSRAVAQTV